MNVFPLEELYKYFHSVFYYYGYRLIFNVPNQKSKMLH